MKKTVVFERSAELDWQGDIVRGSGSVRAQTASFAVDVTFPSLRGEPAGMTTPEELLAAAHATCYGIGLRSVIARAGASVSRIGVTATITAEKGPQGIRVTRSHLSAVLYDLINLDASALAECANAAKEECTISNALRGNLDISCEVVAIPAVQVG